MFIQLPKIHTEVEEELNRFILKLANKYNIRLNFIQDSKSIENSVESIAYIFVRLNQDVVGELSEEDLKNFEAIRNSREKEIKKLLNTQYYKNHPNCKKAKELKRELNELIWSKK